MCILESEIDKLKHYSDYICILKIIINEYLESCKKWDKICDRKINLKKVQIRDIYDSDNGKITKEFQCYLDSFKYIMSDIRFNIVDKLLANNINFNGKIKLYSRVKANESLMQKILKKMDEDEGKFSIKKSINDLLGFRIIDSDFEKNEKYIKSKIKNIKTYNVNIKSIERKLLTGYNGYHIYIIRDNHTFPIEIQIWDKKYERNNKKLHAKHKEKYLKNIIKEYNNY